MYEQSSKANSKSNNFVNKILYVWNLLAPNAIAVENERQMSFQHLVEMICD